MLVTMARHVEVTQTFSPRRSRQDTPVAAEAAQLVILAGPGAGCCHPLGRMTTIGRTHENTIPVPADDVSRAHVQIALDRKGRYVLKDLVSKNGTMVNGVPVREHVLKFGDKIRLGRSTVMIFNTFDPAEAELVRSQRLDLVGEIAAALAHDFNNLLGALRANIEYLRVVLPRESRLDAPKVVQVLEESDQAIDRAVQLARRLGGFALDRQQLQPVDVAAVVDEVAGLMRHSLGHNIEVEVKHLARPLVDGDPGQLHQVLANVCLNARDAMPEGGRLRIALDTVVLGPEDDSAPLLPPGEYARLRVTDTGVGMKPDVAARAFEPLFTTKGGGKGTGLGLATVYSIVKQHGGAASLESAVGKGTTVTILLPRRRPPSP